MHPAIFGLATRLQSAWGLPGLMNVLIRASTTGLASRGVHVWGYPGTKILANGRPKRPLPRQSAWLGGSSMSRNLYFGSLAWVLAGVGATSFCGTWCAVHAWSGVGKRRPAKSSSSMQLDTLPTQPCAAISLADAESQMQQRSLDPGSTAHVMQVLRSSSRDTLVSGSSTVATSAW